METTFGVANDSLSSTLQESACEVSKHPVTGQNALFALRAFNAMEVLSPFSSASRSSRPTYLTVQLSDDLHIELSPPVLQYMNHSCEPNCFFDTTRMEIVALKDIERGEELSFFYPSTEWHMAQPFTCLCGTLSCLQVIQGAATLSDDILENYRLTDFIQSKLQQR